MSLEEPPPIPADPPSAINIDLQIIDEAPSLPSQADFEQWASVVANNLDCQGSITVRIVEEAEIQQLNRDYRQKDKTTNVLSFPMEIPDFIDIQPKPLGDIVICRAVIESEAKAQQKNLQAHWCHMLIHGLLHLLGYDHIDETDAEEMESLEIRLLQQLTINNPYQHSGA